MHNLRSDASDNRARILAAARAAFAAEGTDVPVREIARRAQVSAATVYRRFPTKEALFAEAFAEQLTVCSSIVEEGVAAADPWQGLSLVVEKLLEANARDQGMRALLARLSGTADRHRTLRMVLDLVRRAKEAGDLRQDIVLEDIVLAIMANDGIRAASPETRAAASRRFAALMLQSFRANPTPAPLPPAVRLPLAVR
jgi:AcrR family transcriptional regulator